MNEEPKNQIRQLPRAQRRIVGVLMEKAFTTPDQYPLTLKAATSAANQKSNRSPLTQYSEGDVQDALDGMARLAGQRRPTRKTATTTMGNDARKA